MALRQLLILDASDALGDLRVPPGNRLEKQAGSGERWLGEVHNQRIAQPRFRIPNVVRPHSRLAAPALPCSNRDVIVDGPWIQFRPDFSGPFANPQVDAGA